MLYAALGRRSAQGGRAPGRRLRLDRASRHARAVDTPEQADALVEASRAAEAPFPALIEIDCDGQRGGLAPDDDAVIRIGRP